MKLLLTLDFPPEIGGIQRYLSEIVVHRYAPNDRVVVGCRRKNSSWKGDERFPCKIERYAVLDFMCNKKTALPLLFIRLFFLVVQNRFPGTLECGNIYTGCIGYIGKKLWNIPYRVYTYGTELIGVGERGLKRRVFGAILRRADTVYALSPFSQSLVLSMGVDSPAVELNPPKISIREIKEFKKNYRVKKEPAGAVHILTVGRLVPHKGHRVLCTALISLPSQMKWSCSIVGDGPERGRLEQFCKERDLHNRVHFLSSLPRDELWKMYADASVFVFPSLKMSDGVEGFGIVLLEAMAFEVPIIASRSGGIEDVVDHGRCALLCDPGDQMQLAHALVRIQSDRQLRKELITAASCRLEQFYSWDDAR
jgi:glycosyltransferase involved in cell wall biosynthesis